MKISTFEDIQAWQNARIITSRVYAIFQNSKDRGFRDQICRASISIGNNIAEGFERQSNNELRQFLYIAKGSSAELRSMLYNALDLGYINIMQYNELNDMAIIISKQLSNFIKTL